MNVGKRIDEEVAPHLIHDDDQHRVVVQAFERRGHTVFDALVVRWRAAAVFFCHHQLDILIWDLLWLTIGST